MRVGGGLLEVPLLFPAADSRPARYVVNDTSRTVVRSDSHGFSATAASDDNERSSSNDNNAGIISFVDETLLRGAASVSSLVEDGGARVYLTTSALLEKPWILSVSLLSTGQSNSSNSSNNSNAAPPTTMIQLDLKSQMSVFGPQVVKVKAFYATGSDAEGLIRLILVDSKGTTLVLELDGVTLEPVEKISVVDLVQRIPDDMELRTISLRPSMISILSQSRMLVAMNPYLIMVDLNANNGGNAGEITATWSHSRCVDDMETRKSRLMSVIAKGTDLLLAGKYDKELDRFIDMAPVLSLCCAENDASIVFTLHSDGVLRRWKLGQKTTPQAARDADATAPPPIYDMLPYEVTEIRLDDMPSPDTWSDADDAIQMVSQLYLTQEEEKNELFVLALYIQTVGGGTSNSRPLLEEDYSESTSHHVVGDESEGVAMDEGEGTFTTSQASTGEAGAEIDPSSSLGCRLMVVEGNVKFDDESLANTRCQLLHVPYQAGTNSASLISMAFNSDRASLITLYAKNGSDNDQDADNVRFDSTLCLQYPTSMSLPVCPQPIAASPDSFVDSLAIQERVRIERLSFYKRILKNNAEDEESDVEDLQEDSKSSPTLPLEECLQQVDCKFLQYLFRPMCCRGTGHILPPSNSKIRRALTKCVPHYHSGTTAVSNATTSSSSSIQVETLNALHEWRKRENRPNPESDLFLRISPTKTTTPATASRRGAGTPAAAATPGWEGRTVRSIYQSLQPETMDVDHEAQEETDAIPPTTPSPAKETAAPEDDDNNNKEDQLKDHERRWRQLLLQIWKEERIESRPLCLALTDAVEAVSQVRSDEAILVRGSGLTSTIVPYKKSLPTPVSEENSLLSLLDKVAVRLMDSIEREEHDKLFNIQENVLHMITSAEMAMSTEAVANLENHIKGLDRSLLDVLSEEESAELTEGLQQDSLAQTMLGPAFVQPPAGFCLPGVHLLPPLSSQSSQARGRGIIEPLGVQARLTALCMTVKSLDNVRRLMLGRYLIFSAFGVASTIRQGALRSYLHSTTLLCASARRVPLPVMGMSGGGAELNATTFADYDERSPPKKKPSFESFVVSVLESSGSRDKTTALDNLLMSISQRGAMPGRVMALSQQATFLARAALAKMYGLVTCDAMDGGNPNAVVLPELGLLDPASGNGIDQPKIALLLHVPYVALPPPADSPREREARLKSLAQCLLIASESDPAGSAMARHAFSLLKFDVNDLKQGLARTLTLQKHIADGKSRLTTLLLNFIQEPLNKMKSHYGEDHLHRSAEYAPLLSIMFQTASGAHEWRLAFSTCMEYPDAKQRVEHIKRLVRSMVDAGDLTTLLALISSIDTISSKESYGDMYTTGQDLYVIASDTLAQTGLRDWYIHAVQSPNQVTDYQGALYALHVVEKQWRSAAQSLDLKFVNARNALVTHGGNERTEQQAYGEMATRRETMILNDLVLAALGCSRTISLVEEDPIKFIVAGEHGEYPSLPVTMSKKKMARPKRVRGSSSGAQEPLGQDDEGPSRLSRLMHPVDVESRAVRSLACRTLYMDASRDVALANSALSIETTPIETDQQVIDALFQRGYFASGLMLGNLLEKASEVRGLFHDSTSHLLCSYLVPLVVGNESKVGRPTYAQLVSALDATNPHASEVSLPPVLVGKHATKKNSAATGIRCASMQVLQHITTQHTSIDHNIAKDVAHCLFFEHRPTVLPHWLEDLMMWGTHGKDDSLPGLFARRRPKQMQGDSYLGDPSALVHEYMMRGMFARACHVATTVLASGAQNEKVASRVPEKGNMDFVPYDKIDTLYNLVDIALDNGTISSPKQVKEVEDARDSMVQALKKHFASLNISEMGLQSARVL